MADDTTTTQIIKKDVDALKAKSGEFDKRLAMLERSTSHIENDVNEIKRSNAEMQKAVGEKMDRMTSAVASMSTGFASIKATVEAEARASEKDREAISELFSKDDRRVTEEKAALREQNATIRRFVIALVLAILTGLIGWAFAALQALF